MTAELQQVETEILPLQYLIKKPQPEDDPIEIEWISDPGQREEP